MEVKISALQTRSSLFEQIFAFISVTELIDPKATLRLEK
jgi:hypothetical protein